MRFLPTPPLSPSFAHAPQRDTGSTPVGSIKALFAGVLIALCSGCASADATLRQNARDLLPAFRTIRDHTEPKTRFWDPQAEAYRLTTPEQKAKIRRAIEEFELALIAMGDLADE